jgi:PAS domain S-box-containing protein
MKLPIFFRVVFISLFTSLLSLVLYTAVFTLFGVSISYILYILIVVVCISIFAAGNLVEPVERLKEALTDLGQGRIARVDIRTGDEFEELGRVFNRMAEKVYVKQRDLQMSEEILRDVLEEVNGWIFELDSNFNFIYTTPQIRTLAGYEPEEVLNRKFFEFVQDEPDIDSLMKDGKFKFECEFLTKTGRRLLLEIIGKRIQDGEKVKYRCIGKEIEKQKKIERELALLRSILEHTVDAVVILDPDTRIVSWNEGAELIFGYKPEEVIGKPLSFLLPPERWEQCRENFKKALLEGYMKDIETVRITKDGRTVVVDQTLTSIYDSNGDLVGFVAIMRDITKKKETEIELKNTCEELERKTRELIEYQKELKHLANIVENSNDAIYSVSLDGRIISWNRTAEKIFGWAKEDAVGMDASKLLPDEIKSESTFITSRLRDGADNLRFETRRLRKDGEIVDVEVTISPLFDERGELSGYSVIARDISAKARAERDAERRVLKFDVERGRIYLAESFDLAVEVFRDLLKCGYTGTAITRKYPEELGTEDMLYYWISTRRKSRAIRPELEDIYLTIIGLAGWKNAVLLDLDYLIVKKGFDEVYELVQRLKDVFFVLNKGILILTLDPSLLSETELKLLKMECGSIRVKEVAIPDEMYEILRFIYSKNRVGQRPSIKDVMTNFNITRNTAKKRVGYLAEKGLIRIIKDGRMKVLELTEGGKEVFKVV